MSSLFTFFLVLVIGWSMSFFDAAQAQWFGRNKDSEPKKVHAAPPPKDAMETECGEYRRKIGAINSSNGFVQTLNIPKREWLLARNKKCIQKWGEQEYKYLRNAEIKPDNTQAENTAPPSESNQTENDQKE